MSDSEDEVDYELEDFTLGPYKISVTTIAFLPISILMNNREKEKEISGQKLWCGSLCLVNYLFKYPEIVRNAHIVELGAGTGVVSMIAEKLGAEKVIATDHDQLSLDHMHNDFPLNQSSAMIEKLDWLDPNIDPLQTKLFPIEPSGDDRLVLLGGDVLYKSILLEPFFTTVCKLFELLPCAELVLCHIPRAGNGHDLVQQKALEKGLIVDVIDRSEWGTGQVFEYCPQDDLDRAQIYRIHK